MKASALDARISSEGLDELGEAPGLLGRGKVATRKLGGLDRIAESLPGQAQLPCLESVLAAADDVETHCSPELRGDVGQVPALGVLAVLVDEGGRGGQ